MILTIPRVLVIIDSMANSIKYKELHLAVGDTITVNYRIKEGEKVWTVFIDVYPINDDGSLLDAAGIAAVAALKNATMPALDKSGVIDYDAKTKEKLPISKETLPLSLTFYKLGNSILLHPTREEQEACDTKVTFGGSHWNGVLMINSCQKGWETTFTADEINHMMDVFPKKYEELHKKVMEALK